MRRGTCMVGGKAAVEAGAVTHGAVRCSAWLGDVRGCELVRVENIDDNTDGSGDGKGDHKDKARSHEGNGCRGVI